MTKDPKLDILVMAAHPDDAELSCSGTIMSHLAQGKKVGILDFTKGEMGTRGTPETRLKESRAASAIMGITARDNLQFKDAFFEDDNAHRLEVVKYIRKYKPQIVIANAPKDRHPDHQRAAELAVKSCFLSGLKQIKTTLDGENQTAWRPRYIYHYIQSMYLQPDFVVDVSPFWMRKEQAIKAFRSQFYDPNNLEKNTYISTPEFLAFIKSRAREFGQSIQVQYGEGFVKSQQIGVKSLFDLV